MKGLRIFLIRCALFGSKRFAAYLFDGDNPPVPGDTITINGLVAEFK